MTDDTTQTDDNEQAIVPPAQEKQTEIDSASSELEADLQRAQKDLADLTETSKRAMADLQNYRKRVEIEKQEFSKFANLSLILELLPVLDNFERASKHIPQELLKAEWIIGLLQVEQQIRGILNKFGCLPIENPVGKTLNPEQHEPLMTGPGEKDIVVEVFETGYKLGDKVIRPSKVKVGDGSETAK